MAASVTKSVTDYTAPDYTYTLHVVNGATRGVVVVSVPVASWVEITSISDDGEELDPETVDRRIEWNLLMEADAEADLTVVVRAEALE